MENYKEKVRRLKNIALELRKDVVEMIYRANAGHPGGLFQQRKL